MRFGVGKKTDLLSPEERAIVDRFERGAPEEAKARELVERIAREVDAELGR